MQQKSSKKTKKKLFTTTKQAYILIFEAAKPKKGRKTMTDFVTRFITYIVKAGIIPKSTNQITATNGFKRLQSESDRAGKRSISYWLRIEYDFAYGYAKDFKTGIETSFHSYKSDPSMSRADISRIKALLKARQAEEDIRIAERHKKIADRAAQKWALCGREGSTQYLLAKKIPLSSARIWGSKSLFIPIYNKTGEMVSYQIIESDGKKRFPFGGEKKGCYHVIGQIDPRQPIIICEGWATGVSINQAINQPVIVAFDAGNLLPVARSIRSNYKNTPIIIAADNDESLTGQHAAAKVKKSLPDVSIVLPPEVGQDFNDLEPGVIRSAFGAKHVDGGVSLDGSQPSKIAAPVNHENWKVNLISDDKGRIVSNSLQNTILYLIHHNDFTGCFAYDEFKQDTILARCPPWIEEERFKIESINDIIITQAASALESYGLNMNIDKTARAIDVAANENRFHSAREYFNAQEWDGVKRLETFGQDFLGCTEEAPEYLSFVFKKWLTAAVKRIMEPGCKFDHVLILESQKQGLYKSQFLKAMATFNGECYHTDSIGVTDIGTKDCIMKMQGRLFVELAELSGFSQKDDNIIKNWITQTIDEVRIPYARKIVEYPRQFVLAATTNNYDYLKDPTGNRRYWPVTIERAIDIKYLETVKGQLWAEAVHYYRQGLYIGPTNEENNLAELEREKRISTDIWTGSVMRALDVINMVEFRTEDVTEAMNLKMHEKNEVTARRVANILRQNGYTNEPRWNARLKKSVRVWSKQ